MRIDVSDEPADYVRIRFICPYDGSTLNTLHVHSGMRSFTLTQQAAYVRRKIVARSHNHSCHGKATMRFLCIVELRKSATENKVGSIVADNNAAILNIIHINIKINHSNAELNPICHLLALLGAHHILHVSRIRVKANRKQIR
jgi:hypothetical protein